MPILAYYPQNKYIQHKLVSPSYIFVFFDGYTFCHFDVGHSCVWLRVLLPMKLCHGVSLGS